LSFHPERNVVKKEIENIWKYMGIMTEEQRVLETHPEATTVTVGNH